MQAYLKIGQFKSGSRAVEEITLNMPQRHGYLHSRKIANIVIKRINQQSSKLNPRAVLISRFIKYDIRNERS